MSHSTPSCTTKKGTGRGLTKLSISFLNSWIASVSDPVSSSSSSGGSNDDLLTRTALPPFVFCRLVAPTPSTTALRLVVTRGGTTDGLWLYRVGRAAAIAGGGTAGLDVVGPWVRGRAMVETTGASGRLASGEDESMDEKDGVVISCRM